MGDIALFVVSILLLFALVAMLWLQENSMFTSQESQGSEKPAHRSDAAGDAKYETSGPSADTPLSSYQHAIAADLTEQCADQNGAKEQRTYENWLHGFWYEITFTDAVVAVFTMLMFVVAIGQCSMSSSANKIASESAKSGEAAVAAAKESVEIARETAKLQLRAYLVIDDIKTDYDYAKSKGRLLIKLKNSGQTPAFNTRIRVEESYKDFRDTETYYEQLAVRGRHGIGTTETIGAGGGPTMIYPVNEKLSEPELKGGTKIYFVYGDVQYSDVFGTEYKFDFKYFIGGTDVGLGHEGSMVLVPIRPGSN